ncbi:MAG: hypothetical protein ACYC28_00790 [Longimicrobiales bacterium]
MRRTHRLIPAMATLLLAACGGAGNGEQASVGDNAEEASAAAGNSDAPRADDVPDVVEADAPTPAQADAPTPAQAADVVRRYYDAIAAGEHERAYRLWSDSGATSGQSLEEFSRGYAQTARVQVEVGAPSAPEGAAGSVYVKVPVVVRAVTASGEQQHFEGTYTLRRSNVDGATAEQRAWRIYDATISAARGGSRVPDA